MIRRILAFAAFCLGAVALAAGSVQVGSLKLLMDRMAPDGVADAFPLERVAAIQGRALVMGAAWMLLGVVIAVLRPALLGSAATPWSSLVAGSRRAGAEALHFVRTERLHCCLLLVLMIYFAAVAVAVLAQPMRSDEATTFIRYVNKPWVYTLSVYTTNNHVLHSLLAKWSVLLFGEAPWAIRLPALMAGISVIPLGYWAARAQMDRSVALLVATLAATSTYLVDFATNARGYSIVMAIFMCLIALAPRLIEKKRSTAALAFVALSVAGVLTVPIMVYPCAIVALWLLFAMWGDARAKARLPELLALGVTAGLLTVALYSPMLTVSGGETLVANEVITKSTVESSFGLLYPLVRMCRGLWWNFSYGQPWPLKYLLVGALAAYPLLYRWLPGRAGRLFLATLVAVPLVMLTTRAKPPPWAVSFLFGPYILLSAAGVIASLRALRCSPQLIERFAVAALAVIVLASGWIQLTRNPAANVSWYVGYPDGEAAADYLAGVLGPRDGISVHAVARSPIFYHLDQQGIWGDDYDLVTRSEPPTDSIYFINSIHGARVEERVELTAQGFDLEELAIELEESTILRLSRSER